MNTIRWKKSKRLDRYPWKDITHDNRVNKLDTNDIIEKYNISRGKLNRAKKQGLLNYIPPKRKVVISEETKKKISESRKKFLKNNPDKHPWRNKDKFQSEPCEHIKKKLKNKNIKFIEEFIPIDERAFSIDIAFPDKKIGIEINGQQHYNKYGKLKKYYQERHDLIESYGWKLHEFHYSLAWNDEIFNNIIDIINNSKKEIEFDYEQYVIEKTKEKQINITCPKCGGKKFTLSIQCRSCETKDRQELGKSRNITWPEKSILEKEVWETPSIQLAKKYDVSDVTIKKWCKRYGIEKPPRGYWNRIASGMTHEEALNPPIKEKTSIKEPLSENDIKEINQLLSDGELSLRKIGELFNRSKTVISNIRDGKSYK